MQRRRPLRSASTTASLSEPRELTLKAADIGEDGDLLVNLLAENHSHADNRGRHHIVMEGYGYRGYRGGGLDYLLKRSEV